MAKEKTSELNERGLQAQMKDEPANYYDGYLMYRGLGINRTIVDAYDIYRDKYPARVAAPRNSVKASQESGSSNETVQVPKPKKSLTNSADVSGQFRLMSQRFKWKERAADYDRKLGSVTLDRQVCTEKDDFLDRIAEAQRMLQALAFKSIAISQAGLDLLAKNMKALEQEEIDEEGSVKPSKVAEISRAQLVVMQATEIARRELQEAMGIADLQGAIEQINKRANS